MILYNIYKKELKKIFGKYERSDGLITGLIENQRYRLTIFRFFMFRSKFWPVHRVVVNLSLSNLYDLSRVMSNDIKWPTVRYFLFKDGYRGKCRQGCLNQVREFMSRMVKRKMFFLGALRGQMYKNSFRLCFWCLNSN